jgi:hypothetical protein
MADAIVQASAAGKGRGPWSAFVRIQPVPNRGIDWLENTWARYPPSIEMDRRYAFVLRMAAKFISAEF